MNTASPDSRPAVELSVSDQQMTAQITVYDTDYRPVASAIGELQTRLPAGVYEVESAWGQRRHRQFVVLNPGTQSHNVHFDNPETGLPSAAPLPGTPTTHEWHAFPAEQWSHKPTMPAWPNGTARLFIFVRTVEPDKYKERYDQGLRLLSERGKLICDFKSGVQREPVRGWTALCVDLPAGGYQLYRGGRGRPARYQPIWLSAGWETQVFIPAQEMPQLDELAYFMAPYGQGFHPDNDAYLTSEIVLDGLCRGVNLASSQQMKYLVSGKFENPWLGILALHAMRLDADIDRELEQTVCQNLGSMIGDHPDLCALKLDTAPQQAFTFPPILHASLKLLREHASKVPGTVKLGTLASRVFDALVTDSPWVAWHKLPPRKRDPKPVSSSRRSFFEASGSKWVLPESTLSMLSFGVMDLETSLPDLFANPDTPDKNPLVADLLDLSASYSLEGRQGDILYAVDPRALLTNENAEGLSQELQLPVDKVNYALKRISERPELLIQPEKMTRTEMSVAESLLGKRSLKADRPKTHSLESSPAASIEAVKQAKLSLKRLAGEDMVPSAVLRRWDEHLATVQQELEKIQEAVLLVDANTQVVYASQEFEKLTSSSLTELATERLITASLPILSALGEISVDISNLRLGSSLDPILYRVQRQRFVDEGSSLMFATVYRLKPADEGSLDPSVHKELRRVLSNITYYASVMAYCDVEERQRYTSYIGLDLEKLASLIQ